MAAAGKAHKGEMGMRARGRICPHGPCLEFLFTSYLYPTMQAPRVTCRLFCHEAP